ncbi:MAG: HNH endonuclease [Oscillospiraceae bacterium]|jgi:hypothetical protein|nr:HNH endonuclease [Oscillospiraceae bacterium]
MFRDGKPTISDNNENAFRPVEQNISVREYKIYECGEVAKQHFTPEVLRNWADFSSKECRQRYETFQHDLAKELGVRDRGVRWDAMGNILGYNKGDGVVHLNKAFLEDSSPLMAIDTIAHESRHQLQMEAIAGRITGVADNSTIDEWNKAKEIYSSSESDTFNPRGYYYNPLEVDARQFGEEIANAVYRQEMGTDMVESFGGSVEKVAEKEIDKTATFFDKLESSVEVPKPEIVKKEEFVRALWDGLESDYLSTYKERLDQTSKEGERGHWEDTRGESKYIPSDEKTKEILAKYGLDGIVYKDGIPDFSGCSESTVEIDNMTENRQGKGGNFEQADSKCAEQWNKEGRDGKTDWTARDVANWRRENGYSWHECNDRKTCQLIPTEINDYFGHFGGVGECNKANSQEGEFDE